MKAHQSEYPIGLMCRVLQVSRSGYYAWRRRRPGPRSQRQQQLSAAIRTLHTGNRRRYGSPRIHAALLALGQTCCVNTVARLMRIDGLCARRRRTFRVTTDSSHGLPVAENLLGRDFAAAVPNQKWVADITYIRTAEGWLYLAVELDLHSRQIVGWAMSERITAGLTIDALTMAIERRRPPAGLIHHSDRGSQYAADAFRRVLDAHSIRPSMSRTGDVYDNAVMESCFATLKKELIHGARYATRSEARRAIFEYMEVYYNRRRLHSTLAYRSPIEYEQAQAVHT